MPIARSKLVEVEHIKLNEAERKGRQKESQRRCNRKHKKERKLYSQNYYESHTEECKLNAKKWRDEHIEEYKKNKKEYDKNHKKKDLFLAAFGEEGASVKLFQRVDRNGKLFGIGSFADLGSAEENRLKGAEHRLGNATELNEPFEGCEMHHISKDVVVYIPKSLHRSIYHNLKTGKGMDKINKKVLEWLEAKRRKGGKL